MLSAYRATARWTIAHGKQLLNEPSQGWTTFVLLAMLSLWFTVLSASIGRPIWCDEFLHYAICGLDKTRDAWMVVRDTTVGVNHGQTGAYMMLDYWILKLTGASAIGLRLPSLISGFMMWVGAFGLFRVWRLSFFWQAFVIVALFCQSCVTFYVGEARPYMPLVGTSVCVLLYYSLNADQRRRPWAVCFGYATVLAGVTLHPYFPVYWLSMCCFAYWKAWYEETEPWSLRGAIRHVNPLLAIVGAAIFFWLGKMTWMRPVPAFNTDPMEWIGKDGLVKTITMTHAAFLEPIYVPFFTLAALAGLLVLFCPKPRREIVKPLAAPLVLLLLAVGLTLLLSAISYHRHYWILPRQWVASIALATIAAVWLVAEFCRVLNRFHSLCGLVLVCLIAVPFAPLPYQVHKIKREELKVALRKQRAEPRPTVDGATLDAPATMGDWEKMANLNIAQGGKVWPRFRKYYGR